MNLQVDLLKFVKNFYSEFQTAISFNLPKLFSEQYYIEALLGDLKEKSFKTTEDNETIYFQSLRHREILHQIEIIRKSKEHYWNFLLDNNYIYVIDRIYQKIIKLENEIKKLKEKEERRFEYIKEYNSVSVLG